jgi:Mg2+/Co2+ transporter CorC
MLFKRVECAAQPVTLTATWRVGGFVPHVGSIIGMLVRFHNFQREHMALIMEEISGRGTVSRRMV